MDHEKKAVLVAVSDIFFYTKIRDALLPKGYVLERIRTQDEVPAKAASLHPTAMILNMNDEALDAFKALEQMKGDASLNTIPVLAFANHEEVETWRRARELGVNKIVSRNEFSSRIRDLMEEMLSRQPSALSPQPEAER
ncbi:MAG: histidine kinase [Nitrospirota bacterium]|nr:histidine kinase [Nitrospirota bacterium]MEC4669537.1 histidine kinase [Nitrospirota bacterium]MEC4687773.1 histidine kinase [Nitrospirota bacterium]